MHFVANRMALLVAKHKKLAIQKLLVEGCIINCQLRTCTWASLS